MSSWAVSGDMKMSQGYADQGGRLGRFEYLSEVEGSARVERKAG
jgi:hypothetical protein